MCFPGSRHQTTAPRFNVLVSNAFGQTSSGAAILTVRVHDLPRPDITSPATWHHLHRGPVDQLQRWRDRPSRRHALPRGAHLAGRPPRLDRRAYDRAADHGSFLRLVHGSSDGGPLAQRLLPDHSHRDRRRGAQPVDSCRRLSAYGRARPDHAASRIHLCRWTARRRRRRGRLPGSRE